MIHHPRGEMCLSCTELKENCSHLEFSRMYDIEKYDMNKQQYAEVACKHRIPIKNVK